MEEQLLLDDSFAEGMPLTEDDFDAGHPIEKPASQGRSLLPPASREAKGAEVSADESITACGCEEVDAAAPLAARGVPRLIYEGTKTLPSWHDTTSARRGTPRPPSPHPETARIKGYPEQHSQHTQMDAERLNQLEARLENLGQRLEDLRGYL